MKKTGIINSEIAAVVAEMGHMDTIAIVDAGFPIPHEARRIDLAVKEGLPGFLDVLGNILQELHVEEMILASEIKDQNPGLDAVLKERYPGITFTYIKHESLKKKAGECSAVVRTGEFKPYANIILRSGVIF